MTTPDLALPSLLSRLPIFPLPGAQLFPHALLPLHIFEPRYRAVTRDCLAGTRQLAIAVLAPGSEADPQGRPAVYPVCGVGQIVHHHAYPDGRYDILLQGLGRVRITTELPPDEPYRLVTAERLDDVKAEPGLIAASHKALLALCDRLAAAFPQGGETLRDLAHQESDPAAATDLLAAALVTEPTERQRLLETLDVAARLDHLTATLADLITRFQCAPSPTN